MVVALDALARGHDSRGGFLLVALADGGHGVSVVVLDEDPSLPAPRGLPMALFLWYSACTSSLVPIHPW